MKIKTFRGRSEIGELGCINLHGLNETKLESVINDTGKREFVDLMEDGNGAYLILDGHHNAYVVFREDGELQARVWSVGDNPDDALVRLNLERANKFHRTAQILGRGRLKDL